MVCGPSTHHGHQPSHNHCQLTKVWQYDPQWCTLWRCVGLQWPEQHAVCPPTGKITMVFLLTAHLQCQKTAFNFKCSENVSGLCFLKMCRVFDHTVNEFKDQISSPKAIFKDNDVSWLGKCAHLRRYIYMRLGLGQVSFLGRYPCMLWFKGIL